MEKKKNLASVKNGTAKSATGILRDKNLNSRNIKDKSNAERSLAESEGKYRSLFESMSEMVAVHEIVKDDSGRAVDYRLLDVNPTYTSITGISSKKAIGALASKLYGSGKAPYLEIYAKVAKTRVPLKFETFFSNLGKYFSVSVFSPVPGQFVTATRDITDFVLAEKALRKSEEQLSRIYNNVSDVLFVLAVEPNDNFRFVSVNKRFLDVTGLPEEKIVGKPFQEVIPKPAHALVLGNYKKAVRTKQTIQWEETSVYPNGVRYGDVYVTPVLDEAGKCIQLIGMVHDITSRKQAEEAVLVSETRYRNLIDSQSDIIARSDASGKLTFINDAYCEVFGETREELLGKGYTPTVLPEDLHITQDVLEKIKKPPYRAQSETRHITQKGIRWFSWENSAIVDKYGKVIELQGVGRDITKSKRAQLEIQRRNEDLALLASINDALNQGKSLAAIISLISAGFKHIFNGRGAALYLPSSDHHKLILQYFPVGRSFLGQIEKMVGFSFAHLEYDLRKASPLRQAIESKKPCLINDPVSMQKSFLAYAKAAIRDERKLDRIKKILPTIQNMVGLQSEIVAPLFSEDELVGILEIGSRGLLTEEDLDRVSAFSGQLTAVIKRKSADEALRKSEESFHNLFENSTIGLYRTTPDGKILLANPTLIKLLGYDSFEDLVKRNLEKDGFEPDYKRTEFRKRIEKESSIQGLESTWKKKDGTFTFVRESAKAIYDAKGKVQYYEGTVEDITELKQSERQIKRQSAIISAMLNSPQETAALLDKDGNVLVINTTGAKSFNLTPEEMLGRNIYKLLPEPVSSDRKKIISEVMRTGKSAHFEDMRSGKFYMNSVYRVNDPDTDELLGVSIFALDITDRKNAEDRLLESERKLRRFNESGMLGIIYWNMQGKILDSNDKFLEMLGYTRNDLLSGKIDWKKLTPPEYQTLDEQSVKELLSKGVNSKPFEKEYIRKDGSRIPILIAGAMLDIERSNGVAFVLNISESKQAEKALKASEIRYRRLFESAKEAILIVDYDTGKITDSNPYIEELLGYTKEEFIGKELWNVGLFKDIAENKEAFQELKAKKYIRYDDLPLKTKTGKSVNVEFVSNVYSVNDRMVVQCNIRNITERKNAEKEVHELSQRYKNLLAAVPEIIMEVNNDKVYSWANNAGYEFFGQDVVGKEADFFFEGKQETYNEVASLFKGEDGTFYVESWQRRKDGQKRLLAWWCRSLKDEKGNVTGALSTAQDITDQKLAVDALHESEERFEAFMNHLPLTAFIKDSNFNNLFINRYMANLMGAKEWVGKSTNDLFSPEVAKVMIADDKLALQEGYRETIEILPTSHKGVKIFETYKFRIDRGDKPPLIGGFSIDATERKKAEEELLRQTEELEARNEELERFNKVAVGREIRMIELKKKINELSIKLGQKPPYSALSSVDSREEQD